MNVVDSCGWVEYFSYGPNAGFFVPALKSPDTLVVPTLCVYEVFKRILDLFARGEAVEMLSLMRHGTVVMLDETLAIDAAMISRDLKLSLADSIILATARSHNATLWTQDAHFEGLEGVCYCAKSHLSRP